MYKVKILINAAEVFQEKSNQFTPLFQLYEKLPHPDLTCCKFDVMLSHYPHL